MLTKVLQRSYCASCKYCCKFIKADEWETPIISKSVKDIIDTYGIEAEYSRAGKESYRFEYDFKDDKEIKSCPALSENGCILKDDKPFDCKIWPLRVMYCDDNKDDIVIALSPDCPGLSDKIEEVKNLLDGGLKDIIINYAKENTDIIKSFVADWILIK